MSMFKTGVNVVYFFIMMGMTDLKKCLPTEFLADSSREKLTLN